MKVTTTPRELMDRHRWPDYCRVTGISEWAVNEGQLGSCEEVTLTEDQAARIGLEIRPDTPEDENR